MTTYAHSVNYMCHYATDEELDWMAEFGRSLTSKDRVVILGAEPGVLLLALKEYNKKIRAVVIDHTRCDYVRSYLTEIDGDKHVMFIVDDSISVGKKWNIGPIHLLIIDTDHTEMKTRREIESWIRHMSEDGTVFFHDYDEKGTWIEGQEKYSGVRIACDDLMSKYGWTQIDRLGTSAIYRIV